MDKRVTVTSERQPLSASQQHQASAQLSDEALMMGYANGNLRAFEQLYARHKDPLLRYFLRQVESRASAEELFQETWQSVIKSSGGYRVSAKFSTWLYHMARNKLIDHYRKNGHNLSDSLDDDENFAQPVADANSEPQQQLEQQRSQQQYLWALSQLPPAQKEVFVLKLESGLTVQEIAETLNQNAEAVKSRLRYATSKLKQLMSQAMLEVES